MRKRGKKYLAARQQVEERASGLDEALPLVQKLKFAKFDETVALSIRLGVDPISLHLGLAPRILHTLQHTCTTDSQRASVHAVVQPLLQGAGGERRSCGAAQRLLRSGSHGMVQPYSWAHPHVLRPHGVIELVAARCSHRSSVWTTRIPAWAEVSAVLSRGRRRCSRAEHPGLHVLQRRIAVGVAERPANSHAQGLFRFASALHTSPLKLSLSVLPARSCHSSPLGPCPRASAPRSC